ncbi:MAG: TIGR03620 family F420-dependent LLM class oxidoreductase [Acidobacteria bacterium]|nr:TIGR03620 family F420-dependent LLM class oxidoreductase [Acidobacteriota bacterium]
MHVTGVGICGPELRYSDEGERADAAAELESLGFTALWLPDTGGDLFGPLRLLLGATQSITVASGILNIWLHDPVAVATEFADVERAHPGRLLLGLGVGHASLVDRTTEPGRYRRPLAAMEGFLDALDGAASVVPVERRMIAALSPKMLALARDRTAGAFPNLVPPSHTASARAAIGGQRQLAVEQHAVLETDPAAARATARATLEGYFRLPNYVNSWRSLGFGEEDLTGGGSDRLIDTIVAWGDEHAIACRVQEHFDAGADHVGLRITDPSSQPGLPLTSWRRLAPAVNN